MRGGLSNRSIFHSRLQYHDIFLNAMRRLARSSTGVLEHKDRLEGVRQGLDKAKGRVSLSAGHMVAPRNTTGTAANVILSAKGLLSNQRILCQCFLRWGFAIIRKSPMVSNHPNP